MIDTNNCPWAMEFIEQHGFGQATGRMVRSGYCTYPVVKLDIEKIDDFIYENSIVRDNVSEYTADHIDRVIESVCNNYGLTIKMISTNYAFSTYYKSE